MRVVANYSYYIDSRLFKILIANVAQNFFYNERVILMLHLGSASSCYFFFFVVQI